MRKKKRLTLQDLFGYWRNAGKTDHFSKDADNYVHFVLGDKKIAAGGNVMSLVDCSCVSLTIPSDYCFNTLFSDCASLTSAPELPATELVEGCYWSMFQECSSLESAPELPAKELFYGCYYEMFYGCSKLNDIKVAFTDWREDIDATTGWVEGVGAEGNFECPEGLEVKYGDDFIPTGWSVNGVAPATTRSFAAPTTKSVSRGLRKAFAPKTLGIQNRLAEPGMITFI